MADKKGKKVIAVLPAYNAEKTLQQTLDDIDRQWVDDIILVDDASRDGTVKLSQSLGLKTFVHPKNRGYGGNQKTCYREALKLGADIAVMVHPDHQYNPTLIPQMIKPLINGECDAVFGSRMMIKGHARAGGMPLWKYVNNVWLTWLENLILGIKLTEYHSGFRAYTRKVLEALPLEEDSDDFVFDTEIIVQLVNKGFKIKEIPIDTRYFKEASQLGLKRCIDYGLGILKTLSKYLLHKWGIKKIKQFE